MNMAAAELLRTRLPAPWSYGVTEDGRIFFINEQTRNTSWLHPVHNHPIQSGHIFTLDLPKGWEIDYTPEGVLYYVDHNDLITSYINPITGETALPVYDDSPTPPPLQGTNSPSLNKNFKRSSLRRSSKKQKVIKETPIAKRSEADPVTLRGWLYKQDSGGLKSWKKRWFVLSDFILFYYKGPEEGQTQGSVLLPSYKINLCTREDGISRKFAFKAEHANMRTFYFAAENQEEQSMWMNSLDLATYLKKDPNLTNDHRTNSVGSPADLNQHTQAPQEQRGFDSFHRNPQQEYSPETHNRDSSFQVDPRDRSFTDPSQNTDYPYTNVTEAKSRYFHDGDPRGRDYSPEAQSIEREPSPVDTGGFGQPLQRPSQHLLSGKDNLLDRRSGGSDRGYPQDSSLCRPDFSGSNTPQETSSPLQDRREDPNMSSTLGSQYSRGYGSGPGYDQSRAPMRNTFDKHPNTVPTHGPHPRWAPQLDSRGYPMDHRAGPQDSYQDSLSSHGSRSNNYRDQNYNVPKPLQQQQQQHRQQEQNPPPQDYPSQQRNSYNPQRDSSALDSMERTLDRSFDSSQPLPGYTSTDSFRQQGNPPQEQYVQHQAQPQYGRPPSVSASDVSKTDSMRKLQEWTRMQMTKPHSRPSSTYSTTDKPLSDGRRSYGMDSPRSTVSDRSPPQNQEERRLMQQLEQERQESQQQSRPQPPQTSGNRPPGPSVSPRPTQQSARPPGPSVSPSPTQQSAFHNIQKREIVTIKEDPNMTDADIMATKTLADLQRHLSGQRLRLSISANDLLGKSHEELVLLLIQLRRDQSKLERMRTVYRAQLDHSRPHEKDYKLQRKNSIGRLHEVVEKEHDEYLELRKIYDELENQLEVTKPLVNLLDNLVRMGSLYGGDNLMMASQYKRHQLQPDQMTEPKKMILFGRQHQEEKLSQGQEKELRQLLADEVDLEDKLQQLYRLDRELQERSLTVTTLQENKDVLEKKVIELKKEILNTHDPRIDLHLVKNQLHHMETQLASVRQQLADKSKSLEEISTEDAKVENEVILLRKKIYGLNRHQSSQALSGENIRARLRLTQELEGVQDVMDGLSRTGAQLSDTIKALTKSNPDLTAGGSIEDSNKPYNETDMDSGQTRDLSKAKFLESPYGRSPYASDTTTRGRSRETTQQSSAFSLRDRSKSAPPPLERTQPDSSRSSAQTDYQRQAETQHQIPESRQQQAANHMVTREVRQTSSQRYTSPGSPPGGVEQRPVSQQNGDGLYHAEMRMVTPEPSECNRYRTRDDDRSLDRQSLGNQVEAQYSPEGQDLSGQYYEPHELSEAEDNMKKFYGLLPKDAARTVREVKKKEMERRSRERRRYYVNVHGPVDLSEAEELEKTQAFKRSQSLPRKVAAPVATSAPRSHDDSSLRRKSVGRYSSKEKRESRGSAADRLFPRGGQTSRQSSTSSLPSQTTRTSANFSSQPNQSSTSSLRSQTTRTSNSFSSQPRASHTNWQHRTASPLGPTGGATVATVRPTFNQQQNTVDGRIITLDNGTSRKGEPAIARNSGSLENVQRKDERSKQYWDERQKQRHIPRGRFMTISSTQPVKLEQGSGWKPHKSQTSAGDLISGRWHDSIPDLIHSEPLKDFRFDDTTIDREVLLVPEKVSIPERYVPDSDDEDTEEDRQRRQAKSSQIKRMLAAQSLGDWKEGEVGMSYNDTGPVHPHVEAERRRREHILDIKQTLAREVTQKSKEVAEKYVNGQSLDQGADGPSYLPKSELSLVLLGSDGRGYIPSLPPSNLDQQEVLSDSDVFVYR